MGTTHWVGARDTCVSKKEITGGYWCLTGNWWSDFGEYNRNGLVTLFFELHCLAHISEAFPEDRVKTSQELRMLSNQSINQSFIKSSNQI